MKLKKLLLVIEIILAIFLIIGIVYLSYKLYLKVMGIQDYAQVGNREIFYTCGSKYGDATIYENGLMIIKDGMKEKAKINLSKDEIKELKKELRKYNFLENKNTYIFLKKENNNKNNTINSSIIKNIFKKEKITTKLKIIK